MVGDLTGRPWRFTSESAVRTGVVAPLDAVAADDLDSVGGVKGGMAVEAAFACRTVVGLSSAPFGETAQMLMWSDAAMSMISAVSFPSWTICLK